MDINKEIKEIKGEIKDLRRNGAEIPIHLGVGMNATNKI